MFLTYSGAYKAKILQFLVRSRPYELTVTKIHEMTNFPFYTTRELYFFNSIFGGNRKFLDVSEFQKVYTAYLNTREDYNRTLLY